MSSPAKKPAEDVSPLKVEASATKSAEPAEIKQIDKGRPAVEDPNDIIKNYKLVEGQYRVRVRILEASDIIPRGNVGNMFFGNKAGSANPYVVVTLLGQSKKTTIKKKTLSPVWDEQFFFDFDKLLKAQIDEASIIFTLMDDNGPVRGNTVLGAYELDITSIYFSPNHEMIMASICLEDPINEVEGLTGMLKVSLEVLGPDDEPTIHNPSTDKDPTSGATGVVLSSKRVKRRAHLISLYFYKAEHLPMLDLTQGIDGYVVVKYGGVMKGTKVVSSIRPIWNQRVNIACYLPNQSKAVNIELWDYDLVGKNDLVGVFKLNFDDFHDKKLTPRWVNLYGPPMSGKGNWANIMLDYGYDLGSHYRGRLFYSVKSADVTNPKSSVEDLKFEFPRNPEPNSDEKTYILRLQVYEAVMLPQRKRCIFHFQIGPYLFKTEPVQIIEGRAQVYYTFPDKKVTLPRDDTQIPDLIAYFADKNEEERRHSFARIKAKKLLKCGIASEADLIPVKLKEDRSLDLIDDKEYPGRLFIKAMLYEKKPPKVEPLNIAHIQFKKWQLRVFIYCARDLPPADETGSSDPYIKVRAGEKSAYTKTHNATLNPQFFDVLVLDDVVFPPFDTMRQAVGMSIEVFDDDDGSDTEHRAYDLIGRCWIDIEEKWTEFKVGSKKHKIIHEAPTWHHIRYDATDEVCGKILIGYALIPDEIKNEIPVGDIKPKMKLQKIHMFMLGIRDMETEDMGFSKPNRISLKLNTEGDNNPPIETDPLKIQNDAIQVNQYYEMLVQLPVNKWLCPTVDVSLFAVNWVGVKSLLGLGQIDLSQYISSEEAYELKETQLKIGQIADFAKLMSVDESGKITAIVPKKLTKKELQKQQQEAKKKAQEIEKEKKKKEDELKVAKKKSDVLLEMIDTNIVDLDSAIPLKGNIHTEMTPLIETFKVGTNQQFDESIVSEDKEIHFNEVILANKDDKPMTKEQFGVRKVQKQGLVSKLVFGKKETFTYDDFDSEPDEDLNIVPEWIKDREVVNDQLEDVLRKEEGDLITSVSIQRGQLRGKTSLFKSEHDVMNTRELAHFKAIFIPDHEITKTEEGTESNLDRLKRKIKPEEVVIRVYIIEGRNCQAEGDDEIPDCYLRVKLGDDVKEDTRVHQNASDPPFYKRFDFVTTLPGAPYLEIEVWDKDTLSKDDLVGYTDIDLEQRWYSEAWKKMFPKPIEIRPLKKDLTKGYFGLLSMWVDIVYRSEEKKKPPLMIYPREKIQCELRVIVWETMDVTLKDETTKANDLYLRGCLATKSEWLETDTHWRCRGKGSFNYRWSFPMELPLDPKNYKANFFKIQMWDRDIIASNDMICEAEIDLNEHRMLDKAYKRREPVKMRKKWREKKGAEVEQLWYDCYHPEFVDPEGNRVSQGKVKLSFEILPKAVAEKRKVGLGREAPNQFPVLSDPIGRFSFDIFSPLKTVKEILGAGLYKKVCCTICCVVCTILALYFFWFVAANILARVIVK